LRPGASRLRTGPDLPVAVARGRSLLGSEAAWLAVAVFAQALLNWHFASRSFFLGDDLLYLEEAATGHTANFLFQFHGDHFSPGRQALLLFLQRGPGLNFELALGILLFAHSVGVVLLQRILRLLFGTGWWTVAVAFAYGISIFVQPNLQWVSAGALSLPSIAFSLASIHAYLCWWRTRRRGWLTWSLVSFGLGLLFYVKVALVPVYLVLLRVLILEPELPLRERARKVASEWRAWALYAVPAAAILALYAFDPSAGSRTHAPLRLVLDFVKMAWTRAFVPGLLGIRVP
jgi:hypothetical protein